MVRPSTTSGDVLSDGRGHCLGGLRQGLENRATRRSLRGCGILCILITCCPSRSSENRTEPPSSSGLGLRPLTAPTPVQIRLGVRRRRSCWLYRLPLGCGVIGNTADSGSAILGSSPGTPAKDPRSCEGFLLSASGRKFNRATLFPHVWFTL